MPVALVMATLLATGAKANKKVSLMLAVPSLAVTWRRLHDAGKSGTYFFYILIPIAGIIMLLIQLTKDSQPGENQFGAPVK